MRGEDATKRETDSPTSATRRARSPKSLTPRASLRLPRGLGGYTRRVRSRDPTGRTMIYHFTATAELGNESTTPS
jgi:hypothetical protein